MRLFFALLLLILATTSRVEAIGPGMYLCLNPVMVSSFDQDVSSVSSAGVTVTVEAGRQIATKNGCEWADGNAIRPIGLNPVGNVMQLTNGKLTGWASTRYYVFYMTQQ